jgi:hypothetical protein
MPYACAAVSVVGSPSVSLCVPQQVAVIWDIISLQSQQPGSTWLVIRDIIFSIIAMQEAIQNVPGVPCLSVTLFPLDQNRFELRENATQQDRCKAWLYTLCT